MKLLRKFYSLFERAYDKKISSAGLAIFRITWGVVLFMEISELRFFKELRYDPIPFIERAEINFGPILFVWQILVVMLILGWHTRTVTIICYLLSLIFFGGTTSFEYHVFYAYTGIHFLMMFMPLSRSYSIDSVIKKVKYTSASSLYRPVTKVSVLYYYLPVFVGVGLVYFDSILFKFSSETWLSGLGMWKPSIYPNFNHWGSTFILNNEILSKILGYTTLVFELIFIFLFWYRRFRLTFLIIGFGLHIGILIVFPIPWFALAVCVIYMLMVPVNYWKKLRNIFVSKNKKKFVFIYDGLCPLCAKTRMVIESVDFFNRIDYCTAQEAKNKFEGLSEISDEELITHIYSINKKGKVYKGVDTYSHLLIEMLYTAPLGLIIMIPGIEHLGRVVYNYIATNRERECTDETCVIEKAPQKDENKKLLKFLSLKKFRVIKLMSLFIVTGLLQVNCSIHSGIAGIALQKSGFPNTYIGGVIYSTSRRTKELSKVFLGITNHPVFMDGHYGNYQNIFGVVYQKGDEKVWLPIIDKNGQPGSYKYGANWVNWTFRVNSANSDSEKLRNGLIRYTAFWAGKNGVSLDDANFIVKRKELFVVEEFMPNAFEKLVSQKWDDVGNVRWKDKVPEVHLGF